MPLVRNTDWWISKVCEKCPDDDDDDTKVNAICLWDFKLGNKFDNSALIRHAGFNGSRLKVQGLKF